MTAALPAHAKDKPIEIWFQDGEAPKAMNRIGQKGGPTRLWARRGARPQAPRDRRYEWAYLFGAVRPDKAKGAALVLPFANADAMNRHLEEIAAMVAPGAHAAVIVDGAGYRQTAALAIPDNITTVTLPSYSPELNPVENVCQYRRQNFLANRVFDDYEAILDACCDAWNAFIDRPDKIRSITQRSWAVIH